MIINLLSKHEKIIKLKHSILQVKTFISNVQSFKVKYSYIICENWAIRMNHKNLLKFVWKQRSFDK